MSQEKIARLAAIQQEIEALCREGMAIAEEEKVIFSLSSTSIAQEYGMGGLAYIPKKSGLDRWGDAVDPDDSYFEAGDGWTSSSSDSC